MDLNGRIQMNVPLIGGTPQSKQFLGVQVVPGPNVTPHTVQAETPDGIVVRHIGGLTKLEYVSALVGAGCYRSGDDNEVLNASVAVDFAQAILNECHRRQWGAPAEPVKVE